MDFLISIAILIMSVVIHEVSHGYTAYSLGDSTAKNQGRLTFNPLKHLDPIGSFLVPVLFYFTGGFIFGWARPVPYDPRNIHHRWGEAMVAAAGPLSNICVAMAFGFILRFGIPAEILSPVIMNILSTIVFINLILAIFNLVPIPPLDGSKVLFSVLPAHLYAVREFLEKYGMVLLVLFIFFLWQYVFPVVLVVFSLLTGM